MGPGSGIAIYLGLFLSVLAAWVAGADPWHGLHVIEVISARVALVLAALSFHEWAHGAAAWMLGDPTAREQGRLTMDPRAHFDTVGLLVVPGLLVAVHSPLIMGWARPVPVDFDRLRSPRLGMALVAAAGPAANFFAAAFCASALHLLGLTGTENIVSSAAWTFAVINMGLGFFNLLPLYPMDGGRIAAAFLPMPVFRWMRRREQAAAYCVAVIAVVLPMALAGFGMASPLKPVSHAFGEAASVLTGSPDNAWFARMGRWMRLN